MTSGDQTSTYPTYGTQPSGALPPTPMPPGMQPGHEVHRTHRPANLKVPTWLNGETIAYVAVSLLILLTSLIVGTGDNHIDYFRADRAWTLITILTVGYMLSRGIAKATNDRRYDGSGRY
ncbi:MAG: sle [Frankiales bacterium]|nr:sle [Frankiales bacterium]